MFKSTTRKYQSKSGGGEEIKQIRRVNLELSSECRTDKRYGEKQNTNSKTTGKRDGKEQGDDR